MHHHPLHLVSAECEFAVGVIEGCQQTLPGAAIVPSGLAFGPVVDVRTTAALSSPQARELAELLLEYAAAERFVYGGS